MFPIFTTFILANLAGVLTPVLAAESWSIVDISTHFMGSNSGLPGGEFPPGSEFNTTVSYVFQRIPDSINEPVLETNCSASFPDSDFPPNWMRCDDGTTTWRFRQTNETSAADFIVELLVPAIAEPASPDNNSTLISISFATVHITANDATIDTSFLTCLSGAPLTGIRCGFDVDNIQVGRGGPIPLTQQTGFADRAPFLITDILANAARNTTSAAGCRNGLFFHVSRQEEGTTQSCSATWQCQGGTASSTNRSLPPSVGNQASCTGPLTSYSFYTSPSTGSNIVASPFGIQVQEIFCQNTFFTSLDGTEVSATGLIRGLATLDPAQNCGISNTSALCSWGTGAGQVTLAPVIEYVILPDRGCGPGRQ